MFEEKEKMFAVLIDSDNVSPKYIKYIFDEISNYGIATYKRIYGDWTSNSKGNWKNIALENSIMPIQQYSYTTGKNATDSSMIIDAMDILYSWKAGCVVEPSPATIVSCMALVNRYAVEVFIT